MSPLFRIFLPLILLLIAPCANAQTPILVTFNGYCGGKTTAEKLLSNPQFNIYPEGSGCIVEQVVYSAQSKNKIVELRSSLSQPTADMLGVIKELQLGNHFTFWVDLKSPDGIEKERYSLGFEIGPAGSIILPCSKEVFVTLNGKRVTKMSKEELLNVDRLELSTQEGVIVKRMVLQVRGKDIAGTTVQITPQMKASIQQVRTPSYIVFTQIQAVVNNRMVYLNPVAVKLE